MEMLSTADDSLEGNPASVKSDDSSPRHEGGRGSPPPKCAICLGTCRNKSFTDSCLHQFCFKCLLTWSKVKAECPLCKQNFKSIIHNVRSNQQYDEYTVEQRHEETTQSIDIDNLNASTRRFRYRTTLTLPRRETIAIQQLLMQHYPFMAEVFPYASSTPTRALPPARRRRSPTTFRRTVYRHNLWARPLPDFTGRFRDCTPEFYRYNDSQMHRLVPWINRELYYLLNENIGHISYVMTRILELLPRFHISSTEFQEALQRYFGDRTEHFLHELYCFASTPYDMAGYDRNVQYTTDSRISAIVNEVISSSDTEASVDSDIVMVSSSHAASPLRAASPPAPPAAGPSRLPAPQYPQHFIPQPAAGNVVPIETISQSDSDDDDEVMVVGYIKPPQDRTPEVVDLLGSDSDVIVQDASPASPAAETRAAAALVHLSLKRRREPDSDSSYRPSPPRRRRATSATTTDTDRATPEPAPPAPAPAPAPAPRSDAGNSSLFSDSSTTSFGSYERRKRLTKKKTKRKTRPSGEKEREKKKKSRSRRRERSAAREGRERREGRSKRKSHSGKGVKKSKNAPPPPSPQSSPSPPSPLDQPSTSSHENRRLKSVVNVLFKSSGESSNGLSTPTSAAGAGARPGEDRPGGTPPPVSEESHQVVEQSFVNYSDTEDTDSDDLPLNLSVQKTYTNL